MYRGRSGDNITPFESVSTTDDDDSTADDVDDVEDVDDVDDVDVDIIVIEDADRRARYARPNDCDGVVVSNPDADADADTDTDTEADTYTTAALTDMTDDVSDMDKWLNYQLQASIFYEEPVSHMTVNLLFVSDTGVLDRVESRIVKLAVPNVVSRFVIARIAKCARFVGGGDAVAVGYRLNALFLYNVHMCLAELSKYVRNPDAFSFFTPLTSLRDDIIIKPTLACFHSLNSIHIILVKLKLPADAHAPPPPPPTAPSAGQEDRRIVNISRDALSASARRKIRRTRRRDATPTPIA
jgi:hypothetical protein